MTSFLFSLYMIMMTMHCFAFYHIIFVPEIPCCLPAYIVPSYVMFLYTNTSYKRIYRLSQLHVRSNRIYLFPLLYLGSILFYTHLCMYFAQDTKVDRQAGKHEASNSKAGQRGCFTVRHIKCTYLISGGALSLTKFSTVCICVHEGVAAEHHGVQIVYTWEYNIQTKRIIPLEMFCFFEYART